MQEHGDAAAVIGPGRRLPQAPDPAASWQLLTAGRSAIGGVSAGRWEGVQGSASAHTGGFIDGVDTFDPAFFRLSPREATPMDMQQRLVPEPGRESPEDAGASLRPTCAAAPPASSSARWPTTAPPSRGAATTGRSPVTRSQARGAG